jgi:hypothetical protein
MSILDYKSKPPNFNYLNMTLQAYLNDSPDWTRRKPAKDSEWDVWECGHYLIMDMKSMFHIEYNDYDSRTSYSWSIDIDYSFIDYADDVPNYCVLQYVVYLFFVRLLSKVSYV